MAAETAGQLKCWDPDCGRGPRGNHAHRDGGCSGNPPRSAASQAYEMPWCALTDIGGGTMHENCSMRTLEMCVQEVIAGNRGFCNPNPRWQGPSPGVRQTG